MTKTEYHAYCQSTPHLPIFMQDWWMDAVCVGKQWKPIANMPCLLRQRMGMRYVLMPQQTQIGGGFSGQTAEQIADALKNEHLAYYYQHYPINSPLPLQLQELGFSIRQHVTYRIDDLTDTDALLKRFSENKKRQIRKAKDLQLTDMTAEEFYAFHSECLRMQGKQINYSAEFFRSLHRACAEHEASHILALRDESGAMHAAVYLVFDSQTCYFLIPCYNPEHRDSGAGARIVLEAILFAAQRSKSFDFEGSMIPGVANHYRQFGSSPAIFYEVEKCYNPLFRLLLWANKIKSYRQR